MIDINETELPNYAGRRIRLTAEVAGETFVRVWYEGTMCSLYDKRKELRRDIDQATQKNIERIACR